MPHPPEPDPVPPSGSSTSNAATFTTSLTPQEIELLQRGHELRQTADAAQKLAERLEMLGPSWAHRYREVRALEGLLRAEYRYHGEAHPND